MTNYINLKVTGTPVTTQAFGGNHVARFATVTYQVTDQATFEVDVVSGNVDPSQTDSVPIILGSDGSRTLTTLTYLTYPGTTEQSTHVFRAQVPLSMGLNTLTINAIDFTDTLEVTRVSSLTTVTVTDSAAARAAIKSAGETVDSSVNEIILDYDETNFNTMFAGVASLNLCRGSNRKTWLTITSPVGKTAQHHMDTTTGTAILCRSGLTRYSLKGITLGSSTSRVDAGSIYQETGCDLWAQDCTVTAKYTLDYTSADSGRINEGLTGPGIGYNAVADANYISVFRSEITGYTTDGVLYYGKVFMTGCTLTGIIWPAGGMVMQRDCIHVDCRHDATNGTLVMLNVLVDGAVPMVVPNRTDHFHCDINQFWGTGQKPGSTEWNNIYMAGVKLIEDPARTADNTADGILKKNGTAFGLYGDKSYQTKMTNMIIRDCSIATSKQTGTNYMQNAGIITNALFENLTFYTDNSSLLCRANWPNPSYEEQFAPTNVHYKNMRISAYSFFSTANGNRSVTGGAGEQTVAIQTAADLSFPPANTMTFHAPNYTTPLYL